ncbi:9307_t:CDS:2 [Cetraspora pellucida]|uniref:9307_t:CDS:1 n=1 Tax=Cetraspora pellucida TaxID=1433469 RepID=A0ACA9K2U8_9GLOM|nr:9307_t:CDS:2 [Cetraspora pellucida]
MHSTKLQVKEQLHVVKEKINGESWRYYYIKIKKVCTYKDNNNFAHRCDAIRIEYSTIWVTQISVLKRDLTQNDSYTGMAQRFSSPALVIFGISRQAACSISAGKYRV